MYKTSYEDALTRIRIGAKVTMLNPEPVSWVEKGTAGIITGISNNSLNRPEGARVQVRWFIDGEGSYDHYPLLDVPFHMDIAP
jgi:hypothetical protein